MIAKYFKLFILISIVIFLQNCSLLTVKKPFYESISLQKKYLSSINIDTTNLYEFNSTYRDSLNIEKYALNLWKIEHNGKASVLQIRMYDSIGNFLGGWEQCMGKAKRWDIYCTMPLNSKYINSSINHKLNFYNDLNLFDISKKEKERIMQELNKNDYTIILIWCSWAGNYCKKHLKDADKYVKSYTEKKIQVLKLNLSSIYK